MCLECDTLFLFFKYIVDSNMKLKFILILAAAALLNACAGTVKRDTPQNVSKFAGANYASVEMNLSNEAKKMQSDNSQFSATELKAFIDRKLDAASLLNPTSNYRVSVTIESFRVRSAVAAVMFGIMAGTDSITGRVYVMQNGRSIHSFVVDASYGLGGMMGGDSTRMNWLYDKFAELTVKELAGETEKTNLVRKESGAPIAPPPMNNAVQPQAATVLQVPMVTAASLPVRVAPAASGFADVYDIAKLPVTSDSCKKLYAEWLGKANPKAFSISGVGRCFYSFSTNPADKSLPTDPTERTQLNCNRSTQGANDCKLYAIDGVVVWR